jgi:DNA-binding NtrC family response regulator
MPCVLVVDDEQGVRESLRMLFKGDCEVATAGSVEEAEQILQASTPDLILLDLVMPGRSGLDLLAALAEQADPPPVVVLTATKTVNTAVEAMKRGAVDYITKPFEVEALRIKVRKLLERRDLEREVVRLRAEADERERLCGLVGTSPPMRELFQTIRRVAASRATVLLQGESGTGKELVARAIHFASGRAGGPFVEVNCSALSEGLLESELFGHVKGAFTGAVRDRRGRFEEAHGGTLFLDEIGDVSPAVQVKLLRVLQERSIEKVGDNRPVAVDVRVISATNKDLERLLASGRMREDFYYRIKVISLDMPPLRARRGDIPLLVAHLLAEIRGRPAPDEVAGPEGIPETGAVSSDDVSPEATRLLMRHPWPGNVRELKNALEHAIVLCRGDTIRPEHLPPEIGAPVPASRLGEVPKHSGIERELIAAALARTGWNRSRAARHLGIDRTTLWRKIREYDLKPAEEPE